MDKRVMGKICVTAAILVFLNVCINAQEKGGNSVPDVIMHVAISAELSFATSMFLTIKKPEMPLAKKYIISSSVAILAGVGKEVVDYYVDQFDPVDIGWDILGVASGIAVHWLIIDRSRQKGDLSMQVNKSGVSARLLVKF